MKICFDISQIIYEGTGVSRYTRSLVENLVKIDQKNEYILFGYNLRRKAILDDYYEKINKLNKSVSAKFFALPPTLMEILWNRLHLFPIEKLSGKIDIFHSSDWIEPPSYTIKFTTIHDLLVFKYPNLFPRKIVKAHQRKLYWVKKEVRAIFVDSKQTKNDCLRLLSIPEEKLFVVYPGVDSRFEPQTEEQIEIIRNKYFLPKKYILTVGTLEPRKNLKNTLEAFKRLSLKEVTLVIVGKFGWGKNLLNDKNKRVKILGYVPDKDLVALYSGASCFIYPSIDEGFGFPVLEAMACGCPVVVSKSGSLSEVGGKYATYVDPYDVKSISLGIESVLRRCHSNDRNLYISWAKSFSWKKTASEVLKVYQKFIS